VAVAAENGREGRADSTPDTAAPAAAERDPNAKGGTVDPGGCDAHPSKEPVVAADDFIEVRK
jgi:hypothetical protein